MKELTSPYLLACFPLLTFFLAARVADPSPFRTFFGFRSIRSKPIGDQHGRLSYRDHIIIWDKAINYYNAGLKHFLGVAHKQLTFGL